MTTVEFRVRPVTRYVVTRYHEDERGGATDPYGEFDNEVLAGNAALAFADHETILAQPPETVVIGDRTWTRGKGWSDEAEVSAA